MDVKRFHGDEEGYPQLIEAGEGGHAFEVKDESKVERQTKVDSLVGAAPDRPLGARFGEFRQLHEVLY